MTSPTIADLVEDLINSSLYVRALYRIFTVHDHLAYGGRTPTEREIEVVAGCAVWTDEEWQAFLAVLYQ